MCILILKHPHGDYHSTPTPQKVGNWSVFDVKRVPRWPEVATTTWNLIVNPCQIYPTLDQNRLKAEVLGDLEGTLVATDLTLPKCVLSKGEVKVVLAALTPPSAVTTTTAKVYWVGLQYNQVGWGSTHCPLFGWHKSSHYEYHFSNCLKFVCVCSAEIPPTSLKLTVSAF